MEFNFKLFFIFNNFFDCFFTLFIIVWNFIINFIFLFKFNFWIKFIESKLIVIGVNVEDNKVWVVLVMLFFFFIKIIVLDVFCMG